MLLAEALVSALAHLVFAEHRNASPCLGLVS